MKMARHGWAITNIKGKTSKKHILSKMEKLKNL
jgi:hypothetical protein